MPFTPRRKKAPPRDPAKLDGGRITRVLSELGYDANAPALRLLRVWESAVPREIAEHCEPTDWKQGTLELTVAAPVWAQQIALRKPEILAALEGALGPLRRTHEPLKIRAMSKTNPLSPGVAHGIRCDFCGQLAPARRVA
jgi:predicted nucleic acid-binding Zn ribbon protein